MMCSSRRFLAFHEHDCLEFYKNDQKRGSVTGFHLPEPPAGYGRMDVMAVPRNCSQCWANMGGTLARKSNGEARALRKAGMI